MTATASEEQRRAKSFSDADIDELLARNSTVVTIDDNDGGKIADKSTFSKASFKITTEEGKEIEMNDPDFWLKINLNPKPREATPLKPRKRSSPKKAGRGKDSDQDFSDGVMSGSDNEAFAVDDTDEDPALFTEWSYHQREHLLTDGLEDYGLDRWDQLRALQPKLYDSKTDEDINCYAIQMVRMQLHALAKNDKMKLVEVEYKNLTIMAHNIYRALKHQNITHETYAEYEKKAIAPAKAPKSASKKKKKSHESDSGSEEETLAEHEYLVQLLAKLRVDKSLQSEQYLERLRAGNPKKVLNKMHRAMEINAVIIKSADNPTTHDPKQLKTYLPLDASTLKVRKTLTDKYEAAVRGAEDWWTHFDDIDLLKGAYLFGSDNTADILNSAQLRFKMLREMTRSQHQAALAVGELSASYTWEKIQSLQQSFPGHQQLRNRILQLNDISLGIQQAQEKATRNKSKSISRIADDGDELESTSSSNKWTKKDLERLYKALTHFGKPERGWTATVPTVRWSTDAAQPLIKAEHQDGTHMESSINQANTPSGSEPSIKNEPSSTATEHQAGVTSSSDNPLSPPTMQIGDFWQEFVAATGITLQSADEIQQMIEHIYHHCATARRNQHLTGKHMMANLMQCLTAAWV